MINLCDKSRTPFYYNEILTKSFLINNIANEMRKKYKKVFSVINYDESSLKNDIHNLLSKYISNKNKEINIKYIEAIILNKVKQKYKILKAPLNPVNKNNNKKLIKLIYSSPNKINTYLNINKNTKTISASKSQKYLVPLKYNKLSINKLNRKNIINKNNNSLNNEENKLSQKIEIKNDKYSGVANEIIGENKTNKVNEDKYICEETKINDIKGGKKKISEKFIGDKEIVNQSEIFNLKEQLSGENKENEKNGNEISKENMINENNRYEMNDLNNIDIKNDYNWNYNPAISFEQMKYLERKKRIEEDVFYNQNRYMFIRPIHKEKDEEKSNENILTKNLYKYNNIKINKYSMDKLNEYNRLKEKKEHINRNRSVQNIYKDKEYEGEEKITEPVKNKIQLRILQRSLDQERAIEHLRNILYPQRKLLKESEYQGFYNDLNKMNKLKKREYELADETRKIQIENMKRMLDDSIGDKKEAKKEEIEIEKKYREMIDKNYELFLIKEKQKKMDNYRKILDEQLQFKKQVLLDNNNFEEMNKNLVFEE